VICLLVSLQEISEKELRKKVLRSKSTDYIPKTYKLSESFIEEFADRLCWREISFSQDLSESFMEKHLDKLYWYYLVRTRRVPESFIERVSDRLNSYHWSEVFMFSEISKEFFLKHKDKNKNSLHHISKNHHIFSFGNEFFDEYKGDLFWEEICKFQVLTDEFVDRYCESISWKQVILQDRVSEEILDKHISLSSNHFWLLGQKRRLSEQFIEKHAEKFNWQDLTRCQDFSEIFISKHKDKIHWAFLCSTHGKKRLARDFMAKNILSKDFIKKTPTKDLVEIIQNQDVPEQYLSMMRGKGRTLWEYISYNLPLSMDFVMKHYDKLEKKYLLWNKRLDDEIKNEVKLIQTLSK
jgi:hypothetical protein